MDSGAQADNQHAVTEWVTDNPAATLGLLLGATAGFAYLLMRVLGD